MHPASVPGEGPPGATDQPPRGSSPRLGDVSGVRRAYAARVVKKSRAAPSGTPALVALEAAGVPHTAHAYEHDPASDLGYGVEAAQALGVPAEQVFKTLVARGYVERLPSDVDRRLVELRLTDQGRQLMTELYPEFNGAEAELVAGMGPDELSCLTESLRHIVTVAEKRALG